MSDSLGIRRSSRRRETTKTVFQEGDIVEVSKQHRKDGHGTR